MVAKVEAPPKRSLNDIDVELLRATLRMRTHPDPVSRQGCLVTIDALLDERLDASPLLRR